MALSFLSANLEVSQQRLARLTYSFDGRRQDLNLRSRTAYSLRGPEPLDDANPITSPQDLGPRPCLLVLSRDSPHCAFGARAGKGTCTPRIAAMDLFCVPSMISDSASYLRPSVGGKRGLEPRSCNRRCKAPAFPARHVTGNSDLSIACCGRWNRTNCVQDMSLTFCH